MSLEVLDHAAWLARVGEMSEKRKYFAMYSTLWRGVVTDPKLMLVPVDDHLVHRGDGVFEAIRVVRGKNFLLKPHLDRLFKSAELIGLKIAMSHAELTSVCEELGKTIPSEQGILRIFASRGPGDFSPNPYTTLGAQLYLVTMDFKPTPNDKYEKGVSLMVSSVPLKPAPYATIKSCNYLQNVMMKKESVDRGFDFSLGVDERGIVAEGPTENLLVLDAAGTLRAPKFDYTLRGTTLLRVLELAEALKASGQVKSVLVNDVHVDEVRSAREVMLVGTTLGVLPVTKFENSTVGNGSPGAIARELHRVISKDMGI